MADPSPDVGGGDDRSAAEPERESPTGMPRWVIGFGLVALALLLLVGLHFAGGGFRGHGPP